MLARNKDCTFHKEMEFCSDFFVLCLFVCFLSILHTQCGAGTHSSRISWLTEPARCPFVDIYLNTQTSYLLLYTDSMRAFTSSSSPLEREKHKLQISCLELVIPPDVSQWTETQSHSCHHFHVLFLITFLHTVSSHNFSLAPVAALFFSSSCRTVLLSSFSSCFPSLFSCLLFQFIKLLSESWTVLDTENTVMKKEVGSGPCLHGAYIWGWERGGRDRW